MAQQKRNNPKERQIGKNKLPEKKPLIDPRYKNTFWTVVFLVVLIIFFIVNNTRDVPGQGPLPPGYSPEKLQEKVHAQVPPEIQVTKSDSSKK